jgi:hypothetical protein
VAVGEAVRVLSVPQAPPLRVALAARVRRTLTPVPLLPVQAVEEVARTVAPLARGVPVAVVLANQRVVLPLLRGPLILVVVAVVTVVPQLTLMLVLAVQVLL